MATLWVAMSFTPQKENKGKLIIDLTNYVGNDLLQLDTVNYKNDLGQLFTISKFKYYISNIHLIKSDGKEFISPDYFLVNEEEEQSKKIILNLSAAEYSSINFIIGVDSVHNCSGAQSGALDPANAMFWAWNSGYIFLKLEGKAPESKSPGHIFEYHIGGYKNPTNCIRTVSLNFNKEKI
ncbi:MAG: MbnP family protein, partial [Bacteroidia bacterium]